MTLKKISGMVCLLAFAGAIPFMAAARGLTDAEISTLLQQRIDRDKMGVGIVVGIVDEHGSRVFSHGKMKAGGSNDVNGDTIFEIGSITKIFTTLLLQDMADHGEVKLEDPIGKFLPANVKTPSYKGKEITLVDLATHTSGLPRLPDSMLKIWYLLRHLNDPYAGFGEKELYKFLSHYKLHQEIGAKFEYSNLGLQLLGQVLSLRAGTNYESLVLKRVCEPLKMDSTCIALSPELKSRFAAGHDESGKPVNLWSSPLPGDGALRSSVNDMLKFLSAELGLAPSSLSQAMMKTQISRHATDEDAEEVALGWIISTNSGIIWHNGATSGYCSWIGFNKKTRSGVVVLSNSGNDVDDVGEILSATREVHKVAKIDFSIYDQYAGKYKCANKAEGNPTYTITRKGNRLFTRYNRQHDIEFFPESGTKFFNNEVAVTLDFQTNAEGAVTNLIFLQHGLKLNFVKTK
jgi:serine-type D-Ala-D-Ala carboxypeptidase/endopeptidase